MLKRLAPVLLLMVLTPLVAEYLLGSLSMAQIAYLPLMMLFYGAGAVFVRELARRTHRGWLTILLLALAYGILEEGIACQSFFNPHYRGQHLLDYGFVPPLGIAAPWTLYVLGLHIVWSIAAPVALVEGLFSRNRTEPWLGKIGLGVIAAIFAVGTAMVTFGTIQQEHFVATPIQFGGATLAILVSIGLAFLVPAALPKKQGTAPSPWIGGIVAFLAGSAFHLLYSQGGTVHHWPWQFVAGGMLALAIGVLLFGLAAARRSGWSDMHRFAMAAGALLVYCWLGFLVEITIFGTKMIGAHAALVAAMLGLLILAGFRARRASTAV
jgi:hypothetical protein